MTRNPWLVGSAAPATAPMRLYCFPYAGGSASAFHGWRAALAPDIDLIAVQLPGRAERLLEPVAADMETLLASLIRVIAPPPGQRFAYFGHSLGGLVAYELARQQQRMGLPMPDRVIVSGCDAPGRRRPGRALHLLPDDALIDVLRDYNGTPPEILANKELMTLLLPAVRADFAISERYVHRDDTVLHRPITVLAGERDDHESPAHVEAWRFETREPCDVHWFDGDHFFIHAHKEGVIDRIRRALADGAPSARPVSVLTRAKPLP